MNHINHSFEVRWERDGREHVNVIKGVSDLSEFVRNCDAYDRRIVAVTPVKAVS